MEQGGKRWLIRVVYREDERVFRVVSQLIGAAHSAGRGHTHHRVVPVVDREYAARIVRDEQPIPGYDDTDRTGSVVIPTRSGEAALNLFHECIPLRCRVLLGSLQTLLRQSVAPLTAFMALYHQSAALKLHRTLPPTSVLP